MSAILDKLLARFGYSPTAQVNDLYAQLRTTRQNLEWWQDAAEQRGQLVQRSIKIVETLRQVNAELKNSLLRVQAGLELEARQRRLNS